MTTTLNTEPLTGHHLRGNYVWGIGAQLAWDELRAHLTKGAAITAPSPEAEALITLFEAKAFDKDLISPKDCYTKAGLGEQTLDAIRRELAAKFPERSTNVLPNGLLPDAAIAFSYLHKTFKHQQLFEPGVVVFNGRPVRGFHNANTSNTGVRVLRYQDEDSLAIKLLPDDGPDEIYLIKGFGTPTAADVLAFLAKATGYQGQEMDASDKLHIPNVQIDVTRPYTEMIGVTFTPANRPPFEIEDMKEQIKFSLDFAGVSFENEAVIFSRGGFKNLLFDTPFWLAMKEADKTRPYFMLRVENDAVLEPA